MRATTQLGTFTAATVLAAIFLLEAPLQAGHLPVPLYHQRENGCGAASLAMLTNYWAEHANRPAESAEELYEQLHVESQGGVRLADMKAYLQANGFHAFTIRGTWDDIAAQLEKRRPVLIALRHGNKPILHFAVISGAEGDRVWLHDPARRKAQRVRRRKLSKRWTAADNWLLIAAPK